MCGIAGFFHVDSARKPDRDVIRRMTATLFHRGPDAEGIFVDDRIALGHRRLSIIDLTEAANQPVSSEEGDVWAVFNGEVYNFRDLRGVLRKRGHVFKSRGDSEVIVHAYEEWGEGCFERFDGMLACAIYDRKRRRLLLARDRFGKKPLYYTFQNGVFAFASEIKALKKHPGLTFKFDINDVARYFVYDYVPGLQTIFKGVYRLEPGSYAVVDLDDPGFGKYEGKPLASVKYWELEFSPKLDISFDEAKKRLRELLVKAVEKRLVSDVPLGVFLSGGIDSSSILWALVELRSPSEIETFSIGFREKSYDESSYSKRVAEYFGVNHHFKVFDIDVLMEIFDEVTGSVDEPFADYSIFPTYLLSSFARDYITVALSGDGGDEFLAGYDPFVAVKISRIIDLLPFIAISGMKKFSHLVPVSERNMSFGFRLRRFLDGFANEIDKDPVLRNQVWLGSFNYRNLPMDDSFRDPVFLYEPTLKAVREDIDYIDRVSCAYAKTYLVDDILFKVDRASMLNSLEVRCPFLDTELVEFLARLPSRYRIKGLRTKHLLKEAMKDLLPDFVVRRSKKGFGIPIAGWLRENLRDRLFENVNYIIEKFDRGLNFTELKRICKEHVEGRSDYRKELWSLLMLGEVVKNV